MSALAAFAAKGPAPVYPLLGDGGRPLVRWARASRSLRVASSPRHASVLLVAGRLPADLHDPAVTVHDQIPEPRAVVHWGPEPDGLPFGDVAFVPESEDPTAVIVERYRSVLTGARASSPARGLASNPVAWRGRGPHGQGGEGMMGGTPYGRAMAMTGPDVRDGLELDRVEVTIGPFLSWLPPGVAFDLELQGDVVQRLTPRLYGLARPDVPAIFERARSEPVPIAALEVARARHLLFGIADFLRALGLEAWATRMAQVASRVTTPRALHEARALCRSLRRSRAVSMAARGMGALPLGHLERAGPVARAAGVAEDQRLHDPAYRDLGFSLVTQRRGDADARWRQRADEAVQALELAAAAGDRARAPGPPIEGPRGVLDARPAVPLLAELARHAPGWNWDELVVTVASLDLDASGVLPRVATDERSRSETLDDLEPESDGGSEPTEGPDPDTRGGGATGSTEGRGP